MKLTSEVFIFLSFEKEKFGFGGIYNGFRVSDKACVVIFSHSMHCTGFVNVVDKVGLVKVFGMYYIGYND